MDSTIFKKYRAGVFQGSGSQGAVQQGAGPVSKKRGPSFGGLVPSMPASMYLRIKPMSVLPKIKNRRPR